MYNNMQDIVDAAKSLPNRQRLVVAAAQDPDVLEAVRDAVDWGIVSAILVGDPEKIAAIAGEVGLPLEKCTVIPETDAILAARRAVAMVAAGQGDLVMKGKIGTADILRAVLDKEKGLRTGRLLSHVTVLDIQGIGRLLFMTDAAMNIAPDLGQKVQIVQNAVDVVRALGFERPKVAALAAVELVNPDMPAAVEAALLAKMADRGQIKGAIVDGPLALDNAISLHSAQVKGINSPVAGHADILMVPDIEAGNVLYKSAVYFGRESRVAGVIAGARAPVVLTSRSDSHQAKLDSIAFSAVYAAGLKP
ncbi:MAG TPA: phosphate butyryltransferase [Firmicutes bacterium]|nr:phosphate butyryltransferase [Bacillota bacterium]